MLLLLPLLCVLASPDPVTPAIVARLNDVRWQTRLAASRELESRPVASLILAQYAPGLSPEQALRLQIAVEKWGFAREDELYQTWGPVNRWAEMCPEPGDL